MIRKLKKKGQIGIQDIQHIALEFVAVAVICAVAAMILIDIRPDTGIVYDGANTSFNGSASVAVDAGLDAFTELTSWLPTIALVVAAAIILSLIILAFAYGGGGGGDKY